MSKHNYSQYANKNKNPNKTPKPTVTEVPEVKMVAESEVKPVEATIVKPVIEPVAPMEETVSTVTLPETVKGIVSNCARLNVRAYPSLDAEVICILDVMSEVQVDPAKSTFDWLGICTASGIEGYCMRKFVDAQL